MSTEFGVPVQATCNCPRCEGNRIVIAVPAMPEHVASTDCDTWLGISREAGGLDLDAKFLDWRATEPGMK